MAQWQCVHLVNEKTWRKDILPYSQTDDKTYLCCRTPRLADTNTNNNIRAASWFPLSRTQWKEGMSNFKWNSSKRGEKGQSGVSSLSAWEDSLRSQMTWVPSILQTSQSPVHVGTEVTSMARVPWAQQTPGSSQAILILSREILNWDFCGWAFVTRKPGSYHQPHSADHMDWDSFARERTVRLISRDQTARKWWGERERERQG